MPFSPRGTICVTHCRTMMRHSVHLRRVPFIELTQRDTGDVCGMLSITEVTISSGSWSYMGRTRS